MKKGSERFHELLNEIGALHDKKQEDYGTDTDPFANVRATADWGVPAWVGALMRLNDKVVRLKSLVRKGYLVNESVSDSMLDIAVYAMIAQVLYEEEQEEYAASREQLAKEMGEHLRKSFSEVFAEQPTTALEQIINPTVIEDYIHEGHKVRADVLVDDNVVFVDFSSNSDPGDETDSL